MKKLLLAWILFVLSAFQSTPDAWTAQYYSFEQETKNFMGTIYQEKLVKINTLFLARDSALRFSIGSETYTVKLLFGRLFKQAGKRISYEYQAIDHQRRPIFILLGYDSAELYFVSLRNNETIYTFYIYQLNTEMT